MASAAGVTNTRSPAEMKEREADIQSGVATMREASTTPRNADFPRSASYTYLPVAKDSAYNSAASLPISIKGSFCEEDLIASTEESADPSPPDSSGWTTPVDDSKTPADISQQLIAQLQKSPKVTVSRFVQGSSDDISTDSSVKGGSGTASIDSAKIIKSASGTRLSNTSFARRLSRRISYGPSTPSRSPSPPKKERTIRPHQVGSEAAPSPPPVGQTKLKSAPRKRDDERPVGELKQSKSFLGRKGTLLRKKSTRPVSALTHIEAAEEASVPRPAMPAIPKSFSTDRLPVSHSRTQNDRAIPVPRLVSGEKVPNLAALSLHKKKDELWTIFRSLDGDYTKFQSKSSNFKANVVRSSLLPFLRNYTNHPSNHALRPEDLDRRANILNKWWTGLLEMLHGRNNQSISGTDRPAILDGLSGIMERPEWRLSPSPFCPLNRRNVLPLRNKSTTSLASNGDGFLAESVHHNVRNMFIQNLNAQMAFVVDKMSLRNASASLVTFCGKASAYAFFFCPGIADVLVRLWDLPADTLRRVLEQNGVRRFDNIGETSASIVSAFPLAVQQLGFASLSKMTRTLRTPAPLPLGTANFQWYGYWLERWSGRESDLFYAFVKQYHILVTDFIPTGTSKRERVCVPGFLLVHAQILVNLDSTIHRDAQPHQDTPNNHSPTFDDLLADPDAVASTLPLPPANAIRIMAENRLIMLIRDFLSDRAADHPVARHLFAEAFVDLLHACAKRTSVYDHSACYTLCDFLEEALLILVRYELISPNGSTLIDSSFWLDVCKKMIGSQNTMTEIRLYAFLYSIWTTVICHPDRKADFCLGFLLEKEVFERTFNHWCPMVRAYYMRILCWRVGRYDGEASEGDTLILETLHQRLRSVWSSFMWQREQAELRHALPPSTAPGHPAPGRRLLIVRTDTQVPPNSFLSFDGILPTPSAPVESLAWKRNSTLSQVIEMDTRPSSSASNDFGLEEKEQETGLKGFLRNMMGTSKNRSKSRSNTSRLGSRASTASSLDDFSPIPSSTSALTRTPTLVRSATDDNRVPRARASAAREPNTPSEVQAPTHRNFSFKFSLEFHPKLQANPPGNMRLYPPRLPMPAQLFLQSQPGKTNLAGQTPMRGVQPVGADKSRSKYAGRALAEWTVVVGECQGFFERRKGEGVPGNKFVETPTLGVEVFRRPG